MDSGKWLSADPIKVDISDYFDHVKKVYNTPPLFPFLTADDVMKVTKEIIDESSLKNEITLLQNNAKQANAIIEDSGFLIGLLEWNEFPQLIRLLTIIREWAFRNEGGGVGELDQDKFDLEPEMKQLVILNPDYDEVLSAIVGGYRYMPHNYDSYVRGPMGDHFEFSESFRNQYWIELGRSFINPYYRDANTKKSFDYVLHGLGYISANNPDAEGYFGKITLYNIYEQTGADRFFLAAAKKYMNESGLVRVNKSEKVEEGQLTRQQEIILEKDIFKGLFLLLRKQYHINIVPIMAVYNRMVELRDMHYFGAFRHNEFGNSTEVGIAIEFDDIYEVVKEKFGNQYKR